MKKIEIFGKEKDLKILLNILDTDHFRELMSDKDLSAANIDIDWTIKSSSRYDGSDDE